MSNINESLAELMQVDGAIAAALVDANSGMLLGKAGATNHLEVAAAGNTEVVRAKMKTMKALGIPGGIEDILITLDKEYHILTLVKNKEGLFFYMSLDKSKANLALARYKVAEVQKALTV